MRNLILPWVNRKPTPKTKHISDPTQPKYTNLNYLICSSNSNIKKMSETTEETARRERIEQVLYFSVNNDDPDGLRLLLAKGVDPDTIFCGYDPLGKSLFWCPLHFCCEKGRRRCAEVLLDAGANPDVGDRWCMTPLMYAIQTEWHDMAEVMLSHGASVDLQDTKGRTPLHLALDCSDDA